MHPRLFAASLSLFFVISLQLAGGDDSSSMSVACLGRIVPENGLVHLAAPYTIQGPSIVAELMVAEGNRVTNGQVVAKTHYYPPLEAAYRLEEAHVKAAECRLAQVQAGQKPEDIAAQAAALRRLKADLAQVEKTFRRNESLHQTGSISEEEFDRSHLAFEEAQQLVEENQEKLKSLSEVREVDVAVAKADLEAAVASARHAKAEWEQTIVRSPLDGTVVRIDAWPGTVIGPAGIMELARTEPMYVIAEVYETDVVKVKVGQRAEIGGASLPSPLRGQVTQIGLQVGKNEVLSVDPMAYTDNRVVEVKIRLEKQTATQPLLNAQVSVRILQ